MWSGHVQVLDLLYKEIYSTLKVPLEYHERIGILGKLFHGTAGDDMSVLQSSNVQFNFYSELYTNSANAAESA